MLKHAIIMLTKPKGGSRMLRDIVGIFLIPIEIVAIMLVAFMIDSPVIWIHWLGVVVMAVSLVAAVYILMTIVSVCRRK